MAFVAGADAGGEPVAEVVQTAHFYPYGLRLAGLGTEREGANKHLYNGKELEDELGLRWYHYGVPR